MSDELKHECAVAMVVLRRPPTAMPGGRETGGPPGDFGGTKLSLLLEKQHNRGQDGAGAAVLLADPQPGETPYWIAKSASSSPLVDILGAIARRSQSARHKERVFLGHLRYATFGKNDVAFCHPFVHESSELAHTLLLAGNFNLTNAHELFDDYARHGSFPTSKADGYLICELIAKELGRPTSVSAAVNTGGPTSVSAAVNTGGLTSVSAAVNTGGPTSVSAAAGTEPGPPVAAARENTRPPVADALANALKNADGAWTLCGMTADGWAFATRDPHGIRPGFYYVDETVAVVASERPAIQAAFDVPPEAVKELPPGKALVVSPNGKVECCQCGNVANANDQCQLGIGNIATGNNGNITPRPCSFERIYFSRANDADIHRERKALGAALLPRILVAAGAPLEDIFFSYIPNSARIAFHGLLDELFRNMFVAHSQLGGSVVRWFGSSSSPIQPPNHLTTTPPNHPTTIPPNHPTPIPPNHPTTIPPNHLTTLPPYHLTTTPPNHPPRFGEVIVKDAKFRTFIADAAARREFYKHVYDVTYGLVRPGLDTLVVLDDSIVRGNTMKNAILPMLDRLGPKRIVIASSAPPIRYPDCYGIDMSTLGELVAFKALVNLLDGERGMGNGERELREALGELASQPSTLGQRASRPLNPLAPLYARFTEEQHCAEIARLLTPPGMRAEVKVVYQTVDDLRRCLQPPPNYPTTQLPNHLTTKSGIGDWYFTGDYPTPGGYKVLNTALHHYIEKSNERSY